jgi:Double-GTPase 2
VDGADAVVGMLAVALVVTIVAIAIAVAVAILAVSATMTSAWALAQGVGSFSGRFSGSVRERGGSRRKPLAPEPAFELYVLRQLFADFRDSLAHAAGVLAGVRGRLTSFAERWSEGPTLPMSIGAVMGGYIGTAVAAVGGLLIGGLVGLVVLLATAGAWVLILLLRVAEAVRRRIRHASYECPVDHERFTLPVYLCPACGAEHSQLVPGRWGILKRECQCGKTALPTAVITGRQRVPQRCPSGHAMSGFLGFAENVPIAIAGGPSSGKSTFLAGALIELDSDKHGLSIDALSDSRDAYARLIDSMRAGIPPAKTTEERPPALVAELQGTGRARALYAYDVAGEVFGAVDKVRGLRFLSRSAGIALLIDPFSIAQVAQDHADELAPLATRVLPSAEDPMRVFERLVAALEEANADIAGLPLAVIVAKTDVCGIDKSIESLRSREHPGNAAKDWLNVNGAGNLVRAIEQRFKHVGWFSTSALGRLPDAGDSRPFVPRGTLEPLVWILEERHIQPSKRTTSGARAAELSTATAGDFPLPTALGRSWRAVASAVATSAFIAIPVALVATAGGNNTARVAASAAAPSTLPQGPPPTVAAKPRQWRLLGYGQGYAKLRRAHAPDKVLIRARPQSRSRVVVSLPPGRIITVTCTVGGRGRTLWDHMSDPPGYVNDIFVNTHTHLPTAPTCAGR